MVSLIPFANVISVVESCEGYVDGIRFRCRVGHPAKHIMPSPRKGVAAAHIKPHALGATRLTPPCLHGLAVARRRLIGSLVGLVADRARD